MVAKFTPGPWHANWTRLNGKAIGFHVADETHGSIRPICEFYDGTEVIPPEEVEANARLIAAAPETAAERDRLKAINADLLAALEEMIVWCQLGDHSEEVIRARAAIAAATGEQK